MRAWRAVDVPAVAGLSMAALGFTALVVDLVVRGWWGFATSGWEPLISLGCLAASGGLSWWASTWAEGGWKVLAWFGMLLSAAGIVVIGIVYLLWMAVQYLANTSRSQGRGRRRRRSW